MTKEQVCSQYCHCLSCPLSVGVIGKDCRDISEKEIDDIMYMVRAFEKSKHTYNLVDLFEYVREINLRHMR